MSSTADVSRQLKRSRADLESAVTTLGTALRALSEQGISASPATIASVQATQTRWDDIDREFGLLSSAQVAALQGSTSRQLAYDQRRAGRILGVRRGARRVVYPRFQFDADGAPRPLIAEIASLAAAAGWSAGDVLLWFVAPTTYLPGDARPVDLLASEPGRVTQAAQARFNEQW